MKNSLTLNFVGKKNPTHKTKRNQREQYMTHPEQEIETVTFFPKKHGQKGSK